MRTFALKEPRTMNKSLRTVVLSAAVIFSAVPMFANPMGTNPRPQIAISLGDYVSIVLSVAGL
jgi:hypothetical protein